jgi:xanthine dehydrogenase accessory factor
MASVFFNRALVVVRGGGDVASGGIYRLHRAGFPVVVTELEAPLLVRRAVSFGEAVYSREITIEGVSARRTADVDEARQLADEGIVPVLVDPAGVHIRALKPPVIVDARMAKVNLGTTMHDAQLVIGMGPGFIAGVDCHAVIETNRGHRLGRAITNGPSESDTGEPGVVDGQSHSRVLRAPKAGHVQAQATIGDQIEEGQVIAVVDDQRITAPFSGVLRGLIHERVWCEAGLKIGDLDPRAKREACFTISDKALAVGGGVLEAILSSPAIRPYLANDETAKSL